MHRKCTIAIGLALLAGFALSTPLLPRSKTLPPWRRNMTKACQAT